MRNGTPDGRSRLDLGRLLMVPVASGIVAADGIGLVRRSGADAGGAPRLAGSVLVIAFYAVVIWCYLRRGPALATSGSLTAHASAVVATWLPLAFPLLHGRPPGYLGQVASDVLLVGGLGCSIWALWALGRNLSVLAQARDVSARGPYRWVRHPLYIGELMAALGVAIAMNSAATVAGWFAVCALQVYRAMREEQLLAETLPAYRAYRARTAALVPGLSGRSRASAGPLEPGRSETERAGLA